MLTYAQATSAIPANTETKGNFSSDSYLIGFPSGSSRSLNTSNGQYTISHNISGQNSWFFQKSSTTYSPNIANNTPIWLSSSAIASGAKSATTTKYILNNSDGLIRLTYVNGSLKYPVITTLYYSTSSYVKGSTSYGQVNSTSSGAYPANGRHSDGYWYVAV